MISVLSTIFLLFLAAAHSSCQRVELESSDESRVELDYTILEGNVMVMVLLINIFASGKSKFVSANQRLEGN